jgi:hypothetical protein
VGLFASGVYTTNYWYYRLCRALTSGSASGQLSGPVANLEPTLREAIIESVVTLPPGIGTVPLRDLVPLMAEVSRDGPADLLALEAIAASIYLRHPIIGSTANANPRITAAQDRYGYTYQLVDVAW